MVKLLYNFQVKKIKNENKKVKVCLRNIWKKAKCRVIFRYILVKKKKKKKKKTLHNIFYLFDPLFFPSIALWPNF